MCTLLLFLSITQIKQCAMRLEAAPSRPKGQPHEIGNVSLDINADKNPRPRKRKNPQDVNNLFHLSDSYKCLQKAILAKLQTLLFVQEHKLTFNDWMVLCSCRGFIMMSDNDIELS